MNALAQTHPPFTSAEFHRLLDSGAFGDLRVELRGGMIVKMSPQFRRHAYLKAKFADALKAGIAQAGLSWHVLTKVTASFGGSFDPLPDVVVFDPGQLPDANGPVWGHAVKLIVEVADTTLDDDMGPKRDDYAKAGVAEYWVADVDASRVIRHAAPEGAAYGVELPTAFSEPLAMLTAPSFVVRLG